MKRGNSVTVGVHEVDNVMKLQCIRARVHGRVQRVAFREYTRRTAVDLKLNGWVKNCTDGTVEVFAEGEAKQIDQLLSWLHVGSPFSQVTQVDYNEESPQGISGPFEIRFAP
ncbi:MAG: acylphosphatase [Desulfobulbus sp.]|nr:acylphosphatase [Desulfobulbus sp.]